MPTIEDLGKKVKAKYPGQYDDLKDVELGQKIKAKYPKEYSDFTDVAFSKPKTAFQKQAAANIRSIGVEQTHATEKQEIANAKGKFAGHAVEATALGAAGLATGGLALGPGLAAMGGAGVAGGLAREGAKSIAGSNEIPMTAKDLGKTLAVDAVMGATGEGVGRGIGAGVRWVGKEVVPSLLMKSAAKSQAGQNAIKELQGSTLDSLRAVADVKSKWNPLSGSYEAPKVDIADAYKTLKQSLGKRVTGLSKPFEERMVGIEAKLHAAGGDTVKGLMETMADLNHLTYKTKGINTDEFRAMRDFTNSVGEKLGVKIKEVGGEAGTQLWKEFKDFTKLQRDHDVAGRLAEEGLDKFLGIAGKAPGVKTAIDAAREKIAPALLEHIFSDKHGAELMKRAITLAAEDPSKSRKAFEAAMRVSNAGTLFFPKIKEWLASTEAPTMGSVVNPEKKP